MEKEKSAHTKQTIIVGLSGGLNSAVAAMLLKIQKMDLIAVTILPSANFTADPDKNFACHINSEKVQKIKDFCHSLNIPLHLVQADEAFADKVASRWISQKICGAINDQCFSCHKMRMRFLYEKMIELGASGIGTGHFAKVYTNPTNGDVSISSANDEVHDQSSLLSSVENEILHKLILPLSDLSMKEVTKLADNFFLSFKEPEIKIHHCFPNTPELINYFEANVPYSLREEGDIYDLGREHNLGQHQGIHHIDFKSEVITHGKHSHNGDHYKLAKYSMLDKVVEVAHPESFKSKGVHLMNCQFLDGVDSSFPLKCYLKMNEQFHEAMIFPKNLQGAYIELAESIELPLGELVTCYKRKGKNSKVLLSGIIKTRGNFHLVQRDEDAEDEALEGGTPTHEKKF